MSKARLKEVPLVYVVEGQRKGGRWHVSAVHEQKQDAVDGACRTVLAGYYDGTRVSVFVRKEVCL